MRVAGEHAQLAMSAYRRHFYDVQALLEQARHGFVAQIVEVQAGDPSAPAQMPPGLNDRALAGWQRATGRWASLAFPEPLEHASGARGEGHIARVAVLSQRQVCDTGVEIDMLPIERQQLRQVLHNLLQNAFDATTSAGRADGQHPVVLKTEWRDVNRRVRLSIQDCGTGFPDHILKKAKEIAKEEYAKRLKVYCSFEERITLKRTLLRRSECPSMMGRPTRSCITGSRRK